MSSQERDVRRAARRAQLLDDAIQAIREVGPGVTMEQLANAGGVTKPIIYRHFGDRDGLITAIAERFVAELVSSVQEPLQQASTDPQHLVVSTVDGYIRFIEAEPNLYRFLARHIPDAGAGQFTVSALVQVIAQEVGRVIDEQLRAVGRDPSPATAWAYGIVGFVHQAGDWWLDDRSMSRQELVAHLSELLLHGLVRPERAAPRRPA